MHGLNYIRETKRFLPNISSVKMHSRTLFCSFDAVSIFQCRLSSLEAWRLRPNRDTGMMKLGDVLKLASQFLDGSLDFLFVKSKASSHSSSPSSSSRPGKAHWRVDVDLFFGCTQAMRVLGTASCLENEPMLLRACEAS